MDFVHVLGEACVESRVHSVRVDSAAAWDFDVGLQEAGEGRKCSGGGIEETVKKQRRDPVGHNVVRVRERAEKLPDGVREAVVGVQSGRHVRLEQSKPRKSGKGR